MDLLAQFITHNKEKIDDKERRYLVAVSGGIDSVVLVDLAMQTQLNIALAHVNFSLRGAMSDGDQALVTQLAKKYNIPLHTCKLDAQALAKREGISLQMAARNLRYEWFEKLAVQHGYNYTMTAHHADDAIESFFYHAVRGTGIAGLRGILPVNNRNIFRPLLFASKDQIYAYARKKKIKWREDLSNTYIYYERNFLRHKVIPQLKRINPNLPQTFQQTFWRMRQLESFFKEHAQILRKKVWKEGKKGMVHLYLVPLMGKEWAPLLLSKWLKPFGFDLVTLRNWWNKMPQVGARLYSQAYWIEAVRDNSWVVGKKTQVDKSLEEYLIHKGQTKFHTANFSIYLTEQPIEAIDYNKGAQHACIDYGKLQFPLQLRPWKKGDYFYPLGFQGRKKVSDLLTDRKVPVYEKEQVYVLCSAKDIVWVIGHQIDDRYKVTPNSLHGLCIEQKMHD